MDEKGDRGWWRKLTPYCSGRDRAKLPNPKRCRLPPRPDDSER